VVLVVLVVLAGDEVVELLKVANDVLDKHPTWQLLRFSFLYKSQGFHE
jgi:hypothetical protein